MVIKELLREVASIRSSKMISIELELKVLTDSILGIFISAKESNTEF